MLIVKERRGDSAGRRMGEMNAGCRVMGCCRMLAMYGRRRWWWVDGDGNYGGSS